LQIIKVQELPEHVPTGEMPRNILISFDRHLVGRIQPGAVICAHGIFQICPPGNGKKASGANSAAVKSPYLRCVGVTEITGVGGRMTDTDFTAEEETKFRQMVQQPGFHEKLYKVDLSPHFRMPGSSQPWVESLPSSCLFPSTSCVSNNFSPFSTPISIFQPASSDIR